MAFTQFPHQQYFRILDADTVTGIGYFNIADGTELKHIMLTIFVKGLIATPFDARLNIYGSATLETPIFSSSWATLSMATLDPVYVGNWFGNVYFDFAGNPINPDNDYHMGIETDGYTPVGDTFYLGVNLDWYSPVNNQLSATDAGARIRILGKR